MGVYEDRQVAKHEDNFYRVAAARLSGGQVSYYAAVSRPAANDGAFVEVTVFVPKAEMEKDRDAIQAVVQTSIDAAAEKAKKA